MIAFFFKVKGQKSTYKFDNLPYEYNPGVTRRRRTAWKISTSPESSMESGNYSFLRRLNSVTNSSGANDSSGSVMPPYALRSSQFTSPQPKTQIWFPEGARASQNECERRRGNKWGTFESAAPESRNPRPPLFTEEQSAVGNVMPSLATYSRSFVTPQSFRPSSSLCVAEQNVSHKVSSSVVCARNPESSRFTNPLNVMQQNASRNDTPSVALCSNTYASITPESSHSRPPLYIIEKNVLRNDTPSAATYPAETFASVTSESSHSRSPLNVVEQNASRNDTPSAAMYADTRTFVTPESSHSRSPLYVVEKNASHHGLPSDLTYSSVYVSDRVPFSPPVHRMRYLPLMYVVPVPYEHLPVITSVTGNYSGHPRQDK